MCIRTKSDADHSNSASAYTGAKLAIYSKWLLNPSSYGFSYSVPVVDGTSASGAITQDYEYYDYQNYQNRTEVSWYLDDNPSDPSGSDYPLALNGQDAHGVSGSGTGAQQLLAAMKAALGNLQIYTAEGTSAAYGGAASILTRPLVGVDETGIPLSTYTAQGIEN
jgi:hypothetical protein